MGTPIDKESMETSPPTGRLVAGGVIFVVSFFAPLLIPLVVTTDWAASTKAAVSGFLALGAPELGMLIAIVILGKSGFQFLKQHLYGAIGAYVFPDQVGQWRHRVGVMMFVGPLIFGWAQPYVAYLYPEVGIQAPRYAMIGDALFILSLFVLGGEFWEKLRRLFIRNS